MASFHEIDEDKTIEELRNSGLYPVVNLEIFDTIANLKIDERNLEHEKK